MASSFNTLFRRVASIRLASAPIITPFRVGAFHLPASFYNTSSAPDDSVSSENLHTSQNLITIIHREITSASKEIPDLEGAKPFGFPFRIEDNIGTKTVLLKCKFRNEDISVVVDLANGVFEGKERDGEELDQVSIPLVVTVRKGDLSVWLEFGLIAYPDEIVVEYMVTKTKSSDISHNGVPYEGRDFRDIEENMQKAIFEYLAVRGIEPNVTGFLIAYMMVKGSKEYVHWLKILKSSVTCTSTSACSG